MAQQQTPVPNRFMKLAKTIGRQFIPNVGTLLLVGLLLWAQQAGAISWPQAVAPHALPVEITYQGNLTDTSGDPVTADVDMTFTLYDALTGGTVLWSEAYTGSNAVSVQDGEFTVHLGSKAPFPDDIWENDLLYLGIKVGTEPEMTPREVITAVPRAVQASVALTVPDGSITSEKLAPSWYEEHNTATVSTTSTDFVPTGASIDFTCQTNCTALILHQGLVAHSAEDQRVDVALWVDGEQVFRELGVPNIARTGPGAKPDWHQVSGYAFVNLAAGSHTVEVMFKSFTGTAYYYGNAVGDWEHLNVLVFAQP